MTEAFFPTSTSIELHVPDFRAVKDFYEPLGFEIVWERAPEDQKGYLVMRWGKNVLCFWGGNEEIYKQTFFKRFPRDTIRGYGVEIILCHENIETLYKHIEGKSFVVEPLILRPWGLYDFRIVDPFGYYLRITSMHNVLDSDNAVP